MIFYVKKPLHIVDEVFLLGFIALNNYAFVIIR